MDPVATALAMGAMAGLTSTASRAVLDAYDALKTALRDRFPRVDLRPIEELPDSTAKRASLAEDLKRFRADHDEEVIRLAQALVEAIAQETPQTPALAFVDLEDIRAEFLSIQDIGGSLRVRKATTSGRMTVANVQPPGGQDPN